MKVSKHPLYRTWAMMRNRCNNPNHHDYKHYGGRGISVCASWSIADYKSTGFWNFVKDMGNKPEGYQLDRIDNNKGYSPENCHWVTCKENLSNTRTNVKYLGETASDASLRLGGSYTLVYMRIKLGWSLKRAFTEQPKNIV